MWCQERFKVAIQQLTDGKVISSRIHTCTHRRGEGTSLISYDSTSTRVEGFTASELSNKTRFHARTSFQLAFSSCTIETLDGVAWLSLACTQGVVSICILWGIVERVGPPQKRAAGSSNSCQGWRASADLLHLLAPLFWGITVSKSGEHTAHVSGSSFQLDPGNLTSRRWMSLASLQPFMALICLQLESEQCTSIPSCHPGKAASWVCLASPQWAAQFLFDKAPAPRQPVTASDTAHKTQKFSKFTRLLCQSGRGALSAINECDYTDVVINARLQACHCVVSYWGVHKIFKYRDTLSCRNYCDAVPNNGGGI